MTSHAVVYTQSLHSVVPTVVSHALLRVVDRTDLSLLPSSVRHRCSPWRARHSSSGIEGGGCRDGAGRKGAEVEGGDSATSTKRGYQASHVISTPVANSLRYWPVIFGSKRYTVPQTSLFKQGMDVA